MNLAEGNFMQGEGLARHEGRTIVRVMFSYESRSRLYDVAVYLDASEADYARALCSSAPCRFKEARPREYATNGAPGRTMYHDAIEKHFDLNHPDGIDAKRKRA